MVEALSADLDGGAAAQRARWADTVEVRAALCGLTTLLKVAQGEGMPQSAMLDDVRAMKAKGVEQVRGRNVDAPSVIDSIARIACMRGIAYSRLSGLGRWDTWAMLVDRELGW